MLMSHGVVALRWSHCDELRVRALTASVQSCCDCFLSLLQQLRAQLRAQIAVCSNRNSCTCRRRLHGAPVFPFCRCDEYKFVHSPYELRLTSAVSVGAGTQVNMTLISRLLPVEVQSVCYKKMLASLQKIGFETRTFCTLSSP